jgi:penicillin-binding protein 1A
MPQRERPVPRPRRKRLTLWLTLTAVVMVLAGGSAFYLYLRSEMPSVEQLENFDPQLSTKLLDRNGEVIKEIYTQRRSYVPLSQTTLWVTKAFLAIEDTKFYEHWGLRPMALVKAVAESVIHLDFHFRGASTITQQLARNLYYTSQRSIVRKLREALTAIEIERYYSKDEILEMYLTQTYFGAGAYGIGAAASTYFSKSPADLTVEEAALLAAIPKSPTRYNPLTNPENALARRNMVLMRMHEVGYLSDKMYETVRRLPLKLRPSSIDGTLGIGPYFTETVRQQLNAIGRNYNFDPYKDGVTVQTTLDATIQACAEDAIGSTLPDLQKHVTQSTFRGTELADVLKKVYPQASVKDLRRMSMDARLVDSLANVYMPVQVALVALDPSTGGILAMVGGRNFDESKFNRAVQAIRQPGSGFKPFVYASVLDEGIPITTQVSNERISLPGGNGKVWSPQNYEGDYDGSVDLREGLYRSLNVVAVRLIHDYTSPKEVAKLAHKLGITTELDPYDALALGSSGVIPLDLASAYGVFESGGIWTKPMYMTEIDDHSGLPIVTYRPERKAVLSEQTSYLVLSLLRSVVDRGTGAGLRGQFGFRLPAAGKTGTTNDFTDAWFTGFTPHIIVSVWVGLDDPSKSLGHGMQGARAALPIWAKFISEVYHEMDYPADDFPVPKGIVAEPVCDATDMLATPHCPSVHTEFFNSKFPLPEPCTLHGGTKSVKKQRPSLF